MAETYTRSGFQRMIAETRHALSLCKSKQHKY